MNDFAISRLGLGCMRMSVSMKSTEMESIATIKEALDRDVKLLNTGDFYGINGHNEKLIGKAVKGYDRDNFFISLKYGKYNHLLKTADVGPKNIKKHITTSLKRLELDYVDLYQPSRVDMGIPLEETIGAISDLIKAGYVKQIGLSEVDGNTLKKANAIHPISLVEAQYSIIYDDIEKDLLPVARELGINVLAFGALGLSKLAHSSGDPLIDVLQSISTERDYSISQLAHAWLLYKGEDIIALMGARTREQLEDTMKCLQVKLSEDDILKIENARANSKIKSDFGKLIVVNGKFKTEF